MTKFLVLAAVLVAGCGGVSAVAGAPDGGGAGAGGSSAGVGAAAGTSGGAGTSGEAGSAAGAGGAGAGGAAGNDAGAAGSGGSLTDAGDARSDSGAGGSGVPLTCLDQPWMCGPTEACDANGKPQCRVFCPSGCNAGTHCGLGGCVPGDPTHAEQCLNEWQLSQGSNTVPTRHLCGDVCIDTKGNDWRNCGSCGALCPVGAVCIRGRCQDAAAKFVSPEWPACPETSAIHNSGSLCIDSNKVPYSTYYGSSCGHCPSGYDTTNLPCMSESGLCVTPSTSTGSCSCP
jgi:hypothetical protein